MGAENKNVKTKKIDEKHLRGLILTLPLFVGLTIGFVWRAPLHVFCPGSRISIVNIVFVCIYIYNYVYIYIYIIYNVYIYIYIYT